MIDIHTETVVSLRDAAGLCPRGRRGRPTHVATIARWISRGIRGIRLEAVRLGGCLFTSREALQRFAERLTVDSPATTTPDGTRDYRRSSASVDDELKGLGM